MCDLDLMINVMKCFPKKYKINEQLTDELNLILTKIELYNKEIDSARKI